jgi:hypothetical protein
VRARSGADDVVWAGDARDGINGGGDYVRWIRSREHAAEAAAFFGEHCDRVRISPFLDGVPCSIHGLVLPDGVVVLRPLELATLRDRDAGRFFFGGMGTTWDPPASDAAAMREMAKDLGEHLRRMVAYRGAFSVDGVMTADGFGVTEFNPRFTGGMNRLAGAAPAAHLDLVQVNALIGRQIGSPAAEIEAVALEELEAHRFADVLGISRARQATETVVVRVGMSDGRPQVVPEDSASAMGSLSCGPSPMGAFVRYAPEPGAEQPRQRSAHLAMTLLALSDEIWNTRFGSLEAAPDVRS